MSDTEITVPTWRSLIASFLPGIGKSTLWQIVSKPDFSRAQEIEELASIFPELIEFHRKTSKFDLAVKRANDQVALAKQLGYQIVGFWDGHYPRTFRRASISPALFWFKGNPEALKMPQIAVIGTRHPTKAGIVTAERITAALASNGLNIVSGLALGIDSLAHASAIHAGGKTVAIMPGGLDNVAPKTNAPLAESILASGGGLLSEFPIGLPPLPANFVTRDATQAALSVAVVLIQSGKQGGSLHASRAIVKLKRRLVIAAPTATDIENGEPGIEANALFSNHKYVDVISSMSFPDNVESHSYILRGRDQYAELVRYVYEAWESMASSTSKKLLTSDPNELSAQRD